MNYRLKREAKMTQYSAAELELLDTKSYDAATDQYIRFIQGQVTRAEARAAQLGFFRLNVAPTDIQELEQYLQQLLGYIAFNEMYNEYYSH